MSNLHFSNDPTDEQTQLCTECLETVFLENGVWYHWNTGKPECEPEDDAIMPEPDLFETLGEIFNPNTI